LYALTALAALFALSGRGDRIVCSYESLNQLHAEVGAVFLVQPLSERMVAGGKLVEAWRSHCQGGKMPSSAVIEISRMLRRPELAYPVASLLYDLGDDARVARKEVHLAYGELEREFRVGRKHTRVGLGTEFALERALRCLDLRLRGSRAARSACAILEGDARPWRK
jgi:hypothetical protein